MNSCHFQNNIDSKPHIHNFFLEESKVIDLGSSYFRYFELLVAESNIGNAYWSLAADLNAVEELHKF